MLRARKRATGQRPITTAAATLAAEGPVAASIYPQDRREPLLKRLTIFGGHRFLGNNMTFDQLPLFATDAELAKAICGKRAAAWRQLVKLYEHRGLPAVDALTGGRYVPAVRQFLDALHGVGGSQPPVMPVTDGMEQDTWHTRKNAGQKPAKRSSAR